MWERREVLEERRKGIEWDILGMCPGKHIKEKGIIIMSLPFYATVKSQNVEEDQVKPLEWF